jgi:hypothetical protein
MGHSLRSATAQSLGFVPETCTLLMRWSGLGSVGKSTLRIITERSLETTASFILWLFWWSTMKSFGLNTNDPVLLMKIAELLTQTFILTLFENIGPAFRIHLILGRGPSTPPHAIFHLNTHQLLLKKKMVNLACLRHFYCWFIRSKFQLSSVPEFYA